MLATSRPRDFLGEGLVDLPTHDAVLISGDHQQKAITATKEVFKEKVGVVPEVSMEGM